MTAPAETYQLNTLGSVLGRYAIPNLSEKSLKQVNYMMDVTLTEISESTVPPVPHNNPSLLDEALSFNNKLLSQVESGPASGLLPVNIRNEVIARLLAHTAVCEELKIKSSIWQRFVEPTDIAIAYGLPNLWKDSSQVILEEVSRWGYQMQHPAVPEVLRRKVALDETRQLMSLMWRKVIGVTTEPKVNTYLTKDTQNYHVYWSPTAETLDYATPVTYDRATQLSFDLPHNATHLVHLDTLNSSDGAARYNDNMAQRAYFEAVTVFSEAQTIKVASNVEFKDELASIFGLDDEIMPDNLSEWVIADRKYEFKLRAARYAADVLMLEGASLEECVDEIYQTFGVSRKDAAQETKKYLPWTGLGAVYTAGYRQLESLGINTVMSAIKTPQGKVIDSWHCLGASDIDTEL